MSDEFAARKRQPDAHVSLMVVESRTGTQTLPKAMGLIINRRRYGPDEGVEASDPSDPFVYITIAQDAYLAEIVTVEPGIHLVSKRVYDVPSVEDQSVGGIGPDAFVCPMRYFSNKGGQTLPVGMHLTKGDLLYGPEQGVQPAAGGPKPEPALVTVYIEIPRNATLLEAYTLQAGYHSINILAK